MLQQTRVETAIGYYRRWMVRFPTVRALADADREDVMESWAGLGYYSRARNLHSAAQVVRDQMAGKIPSTATELRALPGVGAYTSGAVASIAFGQVATAVDGNVRRVLARLRDRVQPTPADLESMARELVPADQPGAFNQAMMELGATVCLPSHPQCGSCPVSKLCLAVQRGTVAECPGGRSAPVPKSVRIEVAAVTRLGPPPEVLLSRNPDHGLLGGMWSLPDPGSLPGTFLQSKVTLPIVRHRFTHLYAEYVPFLITSETAVREMPQRLSDHRWILESEVMESALPVAQRKIVSSAFEAVKRR